jgi:CDP-glucose 4,6-dehydratase
MQPNSRMDIMTLSQNFAGRPVFLTGHTGFKGGWLALWLHRLGARVHGYALDPPTEPSLFETARIGGLLAADVRADLADRAALGRALAAAEPEVVFHLAAQPLVRASYNDPVGTFMTNVLGTAHLLDAVRNCPSVRAVVVVTTDKVYQNREWVHPYREGDRLGGHDPYSASKAAAEIVAESLRASFFGDTGAHPAQVATVRAGNVIGGGDWAADRLVPDCLGAFGRGEPVSLRFPDAVRPWQHVLEPLSGYLMLAAALLGDPGARFARAWNFSPGEAGHATVGEVAQELAEVWGAGAAVVRNPGGGHPHEAGLLSLDSSMARRLLGWHPRWPLREALARTVEWHRAWRDGGDLRGLSLGQIAAYEAAV